MELLLNLAWTLIAALMVGAWLRYSSHSGATRRMQPIALALLLLTLFPVISVTDDLQAVQNPAETDSCQRRIYQFAPFHPVGATVTALPAFAFSGLQFSVKRMEVQGLRGPRVFARPELVPIANRPPPAV